VLVTVAIVVLSSLAGATVPKLVEWCSRRMRGRGTVTNSEASQVWEEAREFRRDLTRQIETLEKVIAGLRSFVDELENENRKLRRQVEELERLASELRAENGRLHAMLEQGADRPA
jgi:predicted RNase H-like nuclease (RuvC/YqgF family)